MKKISVKEMIVFRGKSDKSKKTFLKSLDKIKLIDSTSGGDYWVRSISALSNAFKSNNNQFVIDKINDIENDFKSSKRDQTRDMYRRNLDVLNNYKDFEFSTWYPDESIQILEKLTKHPVLEINHIPIQITLNQIFSFKSNGIDFIGAICFIAKLKGYSKVEFGIFAETMFVYLKNNFSDKYQINPRFCLVIDVLNIKEYTYQMILDFEISSILSETINSIKDNL
ncbi:hypothetical protein [Sphingobacterium sp. BS-2]|uniref:hypothetical protein n=1 Tax=Sphingobacterium sp. BS-2 TaxID=3377129 RepID=UPI0038FD17A5